MLVRVLAAIAAAVVVAGSGLLVAQLPSDDTTAPAPPSSVVTPGPSAAGAVATAPPAATPSAPPSPTASPPPAAPPAASGPEAERVASRLTRLLGRTRVPGLVGLTVLNDEGAEVYAHGADAAMLPASTQKLAVAAAALARFGGQHRFRTVVRATASPGGDGVLSGDLVLVGGGDPALSGPAYARVEPERPRTPLASLARGVRSAGIRRITGDIVADPTIFAHEPAAAGWPQRYFSNLDATRITGLTVDGGRRITGSGSSLRAVAAEDPAQQAARLLRNLLKGARVRVDGRVRVVREPVPADVEVAGVDSPPLGELLRYMVQRSDNHLADTIFRSLGAAHGDSTWVGAAAATAEVLAPLQLDWGSVVLADGSGLSRVNRVSARFLAQLQSRMWLSNLQEQWYPLMAVSGEHGTLRHRMRGTVAQGRVYGKTGSLRDVSALVGTVAGTEGRLLHFAVIGNRLTSTWPLRELTDRAVLIMAEELQDCRRERPPPRGPRRRRPPARLVCG